MANSIKEQREELLISMREHWHNAPNLLATIRILFSPVVAWIILANPDKSNWWWALGLFALLAITDKIDGVIAKRYNRMSLWGKFLDPIADKVLVYSTLAPLCFVYDQLWLWIALLIMFVRDIHVSALVKKLIKKQGDVASARESGRITMVLQSLLLCLMLLPTNESWLLPALFWVTTLGVLVALWSWLDYWLAAKKAVAKNPKDK